jgi:DNA repair ATPase RecN
MQNISDVTDLIVNETQELNTKIQEYNNLVTQINIICDDITRIENSIKIQEELSAILIESAKVMRDKAKNHFEKIVTDALQFVSQDSTCKFVIEESTVRGKPAYEFYIETIVNGEVCRKKPEESCGGGFIDIISVTAKVAYLKIFNNPKIMNVCFQMDEPSKMVSEQMSVKFAEYIKFLGKQFGLQIIMITHNENIAVVADNTLVVTKNRNGISLVSPYVNLSVSNITENINNILEEEANVEKA